MAAKPVARLGDTGSHGGEIISAAPTIFVNGKPMARVGDMYACPKHGNNPIVTGAKSVFGQGKLVAHVGSKTACGATITSGSPDTFVDDGASSGEQMTFIVSEEYYYYDEQIVAVDEATGKFIPYYHYFIETGDGRTFSGRTDDEGKTPRIKTQNDEYLVAYWGEEAVLKGAV
jgi:uncharacterized Zn-binding protein involved in type VI secretion